MIMNRACDYCHRRRTKCVYDTQLKGCVRCHRQGRDCTFLRTPLKRGPRRKRELREKANGLPSPTLSAEESSLTVPHVVVCYDMIARYYQHIHPNNELIPIEKHVFELDIISCCDDHTKRIFNQCITDVVSKTVLKQQLQPQRICSVTTIENVNTPLQLPFQLSAIDAIVYAVCLGMKVFMNNDKKQLSLYWDHIRVMIPTKYQDRFDQIFNKMACFNEKENTIRQPHAVDTFVSLQLAKYDLLQCLRMNELQGQFGNTNETEVLEKVSLKLNVAVTKVRDALVLVKTNLSFLQQDKFLYNKIIAEICTVANATRNLPTQLMQQAVTKQYTPKTIQQLTQAMDVQLSVTLYMNKLGIPTSTNPNNNNNNNNNCCSSDYTDSSTQQQLYSYNNNYNHNQIRTQNQFQNQNQIQTYYNSTPPRNLQNLTATSTLSQSMLTVAATLLDHQLAPA